LSLTGKYGFLFSVQQFSWRSEPEKRNPYSARVCEPQPPDEILVSLLSLFAADPVLGVHLT